MSVSIQKVLADWEAFSSKELAAECRRRIERDDEDDTSAIAFMIRGSPEEFQIAAE